MNSSESVPRRIFALGGIFVAAALLFFVVLFNAQITHGEENFEKAQREEIRAQYTANVSHELRTPLNFIIGATGLLNNEAIGILNDKQKK